MKLHLAKRRKIGISVPEGPLEPGSAPSIDELKSMEKDQYFQESDSGPGLNLDKTGIEGVPPSIKSFEELQQESGAGALDLVQPAIGA